MLARPSLNKRQKTDRPAVNGRMIDGHPALGHQLFDVSVTQRIGCVPQDTDEDDFDRKAQPFEVQYVHFFAWKPSSLPDRGTLHLQCDRTPPHPVIRCQTQDS